MEKISPRIDIAFKKIEAKGFEEGLEKGRMEGELRGKLETARAMKDKNLDLELIAAVTGLSLWTL
ncbi:Rpn family recombination-promoting nuclease/putative transposase [Candidatus Bealeia paramacronuclearis]|uniref:Rpn family recombination-promoting nuclease/putative transposase n=1 Tax=Candidatus Bealeia paramacronuclearis TaxID=1921001 RepID=A0ABZ2C5V1_9PROT|nr:Rpn family recombination-promoting nuclease/putative transposase [Candidatus Bealeia paramacronuclearis]